MGFKFVDLVQQTVGVDRVTGSLGGVEFAEQTAQFTRIGLTQECVEFLDQGGNAGFFVHRLIGQRAKLAAQRRDHPAREVQVTALGIAEMLLDADHLLLRDKPVPAAQRLRVIGGVRVIGGHIGAHDLGGVLGDVEPGAETVLQTHTGHRFGVDPAPVLDVGGDGAGGIGDGGGIGHGEVPCMVRMGWFGCPLPKPSIPLAEAAAKWTCQTLHDLLVKL